MYQDTHFTARVGIPDTASAIEAVELIHGVVRATAFKTCRLARSIEVVILGNLPSGTVSRLGTDALIIRRNTDGNPVFDINYDALYL